MERCPMPKLSLMHIQPTHFIVIDDDAISNMMCKFSIKKRFGAIPIASFQKPEDALAAIRNTYHDSDRQTLMFLDIKMPEMNGWDFLTAFDALENRIKRQFTIYILSTSKDPKDVEKATLHPLVSGYLTKPLTELAMERTFIKLALGA
jgi:two-component SAPR family response regulator